MQGSLDSTQFHSKDYSSSQTFTYRKVDALRARVGYKKESDLGSTNITFFSRLNSLRQNPSYWIRDDFNRWRNTGDPTLAHGQENDNSFRSLGYLIQQKVKWKSLLSEFHFGVTSDLTLNTYDAQYGSIDILNNQYSRFNLTDSLLADYKTNIANHAGYIQIKSFIIKRLIINASLRYDFLQYNFDNHLDSNAYTGVEDSKHAFNRITPRVGVLYKSGLRTRVYLNYSQGFLPPQVTDLYRGVKVANLKPVVFNNLEWGWKFASRKMLANLGVYYMRGKDEIVAQQDAEGFAIKTNAGITQHYGIEYLFEWSLLRNFSIRWNGKWSRHEFVDFNDNGKSFNGKDMPMAPRTVWNRSIRYQPRKVKGLSIEVEQQHMANYYLDADNSTSYEGFKVYNIRARYEYKRFEVWSNWMNITNRHYTTLVRLNQWGNYTYYLGNPMNISIGLGVNL